MSRWLIRFYRQPDSNGGKRVRKLSEIVRDCQDAAEAAAFAARCLVKSGQDSRTLVSRVTVEIDE